MHTTKAIWVVRFPVRVKHWRMDGFKEFMSDGVVAAGSFALTVAGIAVGLVLMGTWCLAVFLLTGRFPWFVRRYF